VKRFSFKVFLGVIAAFYLWLIVAATTPDLPRPDQPIVFYSNQHRQDLKWIFRSALKNAHESIFLNIYALTDPDLLALLSQKAESGVDTQILYDASASPALKKRLHKNAQVSPAVTKGLMHKKILITDKTHLFLGSANLTTQSLEMHDNLVLGIYHPEFARALQEEAPQTLTFRIGKQKAELWQLPDTAGLALPRLLDSLARAQKTIYIAMFTLTHPQIVEALVAAYQRGVSVKVAVDFYTGQGASLKALKVLSAAGIPIFLSQGQQLLHHKWAYIDRKRLIMGSANWTKAAFARNQDCFLILNRLQKKQRKFMDCIWKRIVLESNCVSDLK
jgi:cardiolipin synthase